MYKKQIQPVYTDHIKDLLQMLSKKREGGWHGETT